METPYKDAVNMIRRADRVEIARGQTGLLHLTLGTLMVSDHALPTALRMLADLIERVEALEAEERRAERRDVARCECGLLLEQCDPDCAHHCCG